MRFTNPLKWPEDPVRPWPRTSWSNREDGKSRFGRPKSKGIGRRPVKLLEAAETLTKELDLLGATDIDITCELRVRLDGLPYADQRQPDDPGVAVWFTYQGNRAVIARDAFMRVEDNIRSLALAFEHLRGVQRHGGAVIGDRAVSSFAALPPPMSMRHWTVVLGVEQTASVAEIKAAHRSLAKKAHSDVGGNDLDMAAINRARDDALREKGEA